MLTQLQRTIILILFAALGVSYLLWIPPGEGVDEVAHFEYVRFIKETGRLPVQPTQPGEPRPVLMGHHPPLYYLLNAFFLTGQDTSDAKKVFRPNPHFVWAENDGRNGWNVMVHPPGELEFPGTGVVRAFFTVRLWGVFYGLVTVAALFQAARIAFPRHQWLPFLSTAVIAFNPSFLFMSSTIHHDILQAMWFALGTWLLVVYLRGRRPWMAPLAGLLVGLALLTKVSGAVLGIGAATAIGIVAFRQRSWMLFWRDGAVSGVIALLISGFWFARNMQLYGDPLAWAAYSHIFGANLRPEPSLVLGVQDFIRQSGRNFWGGFGFMHITFPEIARVMWLGTAVVFSGWLILPFRDRDFFKTHAAVLSFAGALLAGILAVYLRFSIINLGAGHGRYLFPAAFAIGLLYAGGMQGLVGEKLLAWIAPLTAAGLFAFAVWLPVTQLLPKYAPPNTVSALPAAAQATQLTLSPGVEIAGVQVREQEPLIPDSGLTVLLYWQADQAADKLSDPFLSLSLQTPSREVLSIWEGWPTPSLPPQDWPQGEMVVTQHPLYVPGRELPGTVQLVARDSAAGNAAPVVITELSTVGGAIAIDPAELPENLAVIFGDQLILRGYESAGARFQPGNTVAVTLFWEAATAPAANYTTFVHLLDASGRLVAQLDRPAGGGDNPTSTWQAGQAWRDTYPVLLPDDLPAGVYTLQIGLYSQPSLERLPITGNGEDSLRLGEIEVGGGE